MKTVFITGANRGLGKGFVEYFLSKNFLVFAGARNINSFDESLTQNKNLVPVSIDVSDDASIQKALWKVFKI